MPPFLVVNDCGCVSRPCHMPICPTNLGTPALRKLDLLGAAGGLPPVGWYEQYLSTEQSYDWGILFWQLQQIPEIAPGLIKWQVWAEQHCPSPAGDGASHNTYHSGVRLGCLEFLDTTTQPLHRCQFAQSTTRAESVFPTPLERDWRLIATLEEAVEFAVASSVNCRVGIAHL